MKKSNGWEKAAAKTIPGLLYLGPIVLKSTRPKKGRRSFRKQEKGIPTLEPL
jgi:hypothetical protein